MLGRQRPQAQELRRRAGIDREQVFVLATPLDDYAIFVWDTSDIHRAIEVLATDGGESSCWFEHHLQDAHGLDVVGASTFRVPELLGEWKSPTWQFDAFEGSGLCFPIAEGNLQAGHDFVSAVMVGGSHHADFVATRAAFGIVRQMFFHLQTPNGVLAIMYGEGRNGWFEDAFAGTVTGNQPFFEWWRDQVTSIAAVPQFTRTTPPTVDQVFHMSTTVPA